MKRSWIGIGLLAALLALGIWTAGVMEASHLPGEEKLQRAAWLALDGQWPQAEALTKQARKKWEGAWKFSAALSDHEPMDQIDGLFAELEVYAQTRDAVAYSGTCAHLAELLEAIGSAHSLYWWNLL